MSDRFCHRASAKCYGDLWVCSCGLICCSLHGPASRAGAVPLCYECTRHALDAKLLASDRVPKLAAKADPGDKLDIHDK